MFIPTTKTTTYQFDGTRAPRVLIKREAMSKMQIYVDTVNDEVGWLGTASLNTYETGREIVLEDVFLIKQEVHGTTTELTPEGLSEFAMEILALPDGTDTWNKMRMWGHSHVNMGTSPSGQDDKQMKEFSNIGHDWFVRLIANKKGDIRIDFYEYSTGITMLNLNWEAEEVEDEMAQAIEESIATLYEQIAGLEANLNEKRKEHVTMLEPDVKAEITAKVKKKSYGYTAKGSHAYGVNATPGKYSPPSWRNHLPHTNSQIGYNDWFEDELQYEDPLDDEHVSFDHGALFQTYLSGAVYESEEYKFKYQLEQYFNGNDAIALSRIRNRKELEAFISESGFNQTFTEDEAVQLWTLAKQFYSKYQGA